MFGLIAAGIVIAVVLAVVVPYLCLRLKGESHRASLQLIWALHKEFHGALERSDDDIIAESDRKHRR